MNLLICIYIYVYHWGGTTLWLVELQMRPSKCASRGLGTFQLVLHIREATGPGFNVGQSKSRGRFPKINRHTNRKKGGPSCRWLSHWPSPHGAIDLKSLKSVWSGQQILGEPCEDAKNCFCLRKFQDLDTQTPHSFAPGHFQNTSVCSKLSGSIKPCCSDHPPIYSR